MFCFEKDYDKEQAQLNELTKMLSDKRRVLRDEESKLHEIERKIREKQQQERSNAERLKAEYDDLRNRFEQMAFELRFSIEDELKIYARLLDELMKKSSVNSIPSQQQTNSSSTTISSIIRSGGIESRDNTTTGLSNVNFDLGTNNSSLWNNPTGANEMTSITRTSSYSNIN